MNKSIIALVVVLALGGAAYFAFANRSSDMPKQPIVGQPQPVTQTNPITTTDTTTTTTTTTVTTAKTVTVSHQNSSFSPQTITINAGDTVRFVNNSTTTIRVASDPHPFHTSYPALDSDTLKPGQSYSITFDKAGTVHYHNHFSPGATGTIIVK